MKKRLSIIVIILVALFVSQHVAHAATFTVNSLLDTPDALINGICNDGSGNCTLRAAIQEANNASGADTINFSVTGTTVAASSYGTLTDTAGLTITGPGSGSFTIDASGMSDTNILVMQNSDNGGISGLTISGVINGIWVVDSDNNTFDDLVISGRDQAGTTIMEVATSTGNTFSNNTFSHGGLGIRVGFHSDGNTITHNTSTNNLHSGITISNSANNIVSNNTVSNIANDYGMFVIGGADHNTFTGNTVSNANLGGMTMGGLAGDDSGTVNNNIVRNNTFSGNGSGISMTGTADHNTFDGNTISNNTNSGISIAFNNLDNPSYTAAGNIFTGNIIADNGTTGLDIQHASDITIGGFDTGNSNSITGNGSQGIYLNDVNIVTILGNTINTNVDQGINTSNASNVTIQGNYIGFGSDGITLASGENSGIGITDGSSQVIIGGTTSQLRNYITGTSVGGIDVSGTVSDISVIGNYIGLDINGSQVGTLIGGISIGVGDMSSVIIGGTNSGEGNAIAGISGGGFGFGILAGGSHLRIFGNKVGTNASGIVTPGYGNDFGVGFLGNVSSSTLGGTNGGESNIIAGNTNGGVVILGMNTDYPSNISVLGNSIYENNGDGIDHFIYNGGVVDQGSNANDAGDTDVGPNGYLNHPVINTVDTGTGKVTYTLDVPTGTYRIEFFRNPTSGAYGEGEEFVGTDTFVSTGTKKTQAVTLSLVGGNFITANATEDLGGSVFGATSEFSQAYNPNDIIVTSVPPSHSGGSSSGTQFGCKDPLANNYYTGFAVSKPSLCMYGATVSRVTPPELKPNPEIPAATVCPAFTKYYRLGDKGGEISRVQKFLNDELGLHLSTDGSYGHQTADAVGKFQQKYFSYIIVPWNPPHPLKVTKRWYKTTAGTANVLMGCVSSPVILEDNGLHWKFDGIKKIPQG